jgi:lipoprotein NlpI
MGLRSRSVLGCAWLVFNLLAPVATAAAPGSGAAPPPAARNELEEKFRITNFDDDVEISMRRTMTGIQADRERAMIAAVSKVNWVRLYLGTYQRRYGPRTKAVGDVEVNDDTATNVVTVTLKMTAPTAIRDNETNWVLGYTAINFAGILPPANALGEPLAVVNMTPNTVHRYAMEMEFPAEVLVQGNTATRRVSDEAFDFWMDSGFRGNRATAVMEVRMLGQPAGASPNRVAKYETAARQVFEAANSYMFVTKEGMRVRRLLAIEKPTLRQWVEHNSANTVERTTKAIEAQKLRGSELAQTHCQRASALVTMGKLPEALRDANLGVEASPEANTYRCRASVLANIGDAAPAIADYSKAIEREPLAGTTYLLRGIVSFYGGQLANAAEDFERSQRANEARAEVSVFTAVWRTVALKRLGRPMDPALVQLAAEQPRGAWPRPTLALMHGLISVDEMMEIAQRRPAIEREMAMIEAWFAAGQWYLMQGDKQKAAEAFRKVREQGVPGFVEYRSAAAELVGLEGVKY